MGPPELALRRRKERGGVTTLRSARLPPRHGHSANATTTYTMTTLTHPTDRVRLLASGDLSRRDVGPIGGVRFIHHGLPARGGPDSIGARGGTAVSTRGTRESDVRVVHEEPVYGATRRAMWGQKHVGSEGGDAGKRAGGDVPESLASHRHRVRGRGAPPWGAQRPCVVARR